MKAMDLGNCATSLTAVLRLLLLLSLLTTRCCGGIGGQSTTAAATSTLPTTTTTATTTSARPCPSSTTTLPDTQSHQSGNLMTRVRSQSAAENKNNKDASRSRDIDGNMPDSSPFSYCTINKLFCIPRNYSRYVPPIDPSLNDRDGPIRPLNVSIGFDNFEILKIDDRDFTVEINAYLVVKWRDTRMEINFDQLYPEEWPPKNDDDDMGNHVIPDWLPVEAEVISRLWLPDSEVLRLKGFHSLSVLNKLQGLWMSIRHEILLVVATRIRFMCPMNYRKFPMDTQTCKFQVGSFNYDNTKMLYHTYYLPMLPNSTDSILDFEVEIVELSPEERYYLPQETGNYSVAGFKMVLSRKVSHYIITYYIPSGLFVVVSWASFLIPCDDIQGRMALLVTLFLVLVNIFNAITTNSPKADGLNALQAWIITCIFFVFGALFEYSAILLRLKIYSLQKGACNIIVSTAAAAATGINPTTTAQAKVARKNQALTKFDLFCLAFFPVLFLVFVGVYVMAVMI